MRANQPMGLKPTARALLEGLVPLDSGRFYEGYWDERYPLTAFLAPTPAMASLLAERAVLADRMEDLDVALEKAGKVQLAAGDFIYREYEQSVLYSSGPVMFLALRGPDDVPVAASLWSECEMQTTSEGACRCGRDLCVPGCAEDCSQRGAWDQY